ncbi:hypothetical protein LNQ03_07380 [Klebsiella pneumoniae subsp. pneumoniae]|nr:hypothetical protein [Klebsiella pneumoniae subsp. pneumoniae]
MFQHGVDFKSDAAAQRGINPLGEVMRAASLQLFHRSAHFVLGLRFGNGRLSLLTTIAGYSTLIAGEGFGIEKTRRFLNHCAPAAPDGSCPGQIVSHDPKLSAFPLRPDHLNAGWRHAGRRRSLRV